MRQNSRPGLDANLPPSSPRSRSAPPGLLLQGLALERRGVEASSNSRDQPLPGTAKSAHQAKRQAPPARFSALSRLQVPRQPAGPPALQPNPTATIRAAPASTAVSSLASRRASFPAPTVANAPQYTSSPNKDAEVK